LATRQRQRQRQRQCQPHLRFSIVGCTIAAGMAASRHVAPDELEAVPTIELLNELKRRHHVLSRPPARMAIFGPPCVGKRAAADALRRAFGVCRISAADLLPPASEPGAAGGSSDDKAMASLASMLDRPQCRRGFVLEGFPSTAAQAERIREVLGERDTALDCAFFLDAPDDVLAERCKGRLVHAPSGRRYHESFKPPAIEHRDDYTGEPLVKSFDEAAFQRGLSTYKENVGLLHVFYDRAELSRDVSAKGGLEEVASAVTDIADRR